jgi:hypothetical protein
VPLRPSALLSVIYSGTLRRPGHGSQTPVNQPSETPNPRPVCTSKPDFNFYLQRKGAIRSLKLPSYDSLTRHSIRDFAPKMRQPYRIKLLIVKEKDSVAERGGFEPPVELLTLQRFSKPPPSATRPSLRLR